MIANTCWQIFNDGNSIGQIGSEGGTVLRDEEHSFGARITLERDGYAPFAITCGIYGWMVHTCFFSTQLESQQVFDQIKAEMAEILSLIPESNDPLFNEKDRILENAIGEFVAKH